MLKKMTRFREIVNKYLNSSCLWLVVIALVLFLFIWRFSYPNYLILGGEGNYFLNLPETKNFAYTWSGENNGTGGFTRLIHSQFLIFDVLACLQRVSLRLASLLNAFVVYYLPFFSIFILLKKCLKLSLINSLIVALFYILNPFSSYYLAKLSFWETAILFILPVFFIIINRNLYRTSRLIIYFGMTSLFLSSGFANLPLLGIALLSVPLFLIINSMMIKNSLDLKNNFIKLILLAVSFFLFNFWWIIHFISRRRDLLTFYPKSEAISWASQHLPQNIVSDIFSLRWLFSLNEHDYNFYSNFYTSPLVGIFLFIPLIMLFFYFCRLKQKSQILTVTLSFLLICLLLTAGAKGPFGFSYLFFMKVIPFFIIFKTPWEKFGPLLIFWITISFGLLLTFLDDKQKKYFYRFFALYLIICLIPFFANNFIPESKIHEGKYSSRRFIFKEEYQEMIKAVNKEKNLFRVMSFPGSLNYQVTMQNHDNKYYRGMDPLMYGLNKPFIAAGYNPANYFLFTIISDPNWKKVLSLYNIGKISLNKDIFPSFGFLEKESFEDLEKIFVQNFECSKNSSILLCDNSSFLPRFYIPQKTIYASGDMDNILEVVKFGDWERRSGIYLENINGLTDSKINELEELKKRADEIFIKGELEDKVSEEELGMIVKSEEISLSQVQWKPSSLIYPLALTVEKFDKWKVRKDPEKSFKNHLLYGDKRIAEMGKWGEEKDIGYWILDIYKKEMEGAIETLAKMKESESENFISSWVKLKGTLLGHRSKINELTNYSLTDWDNVFKELEEQAEELKIKHDFSRLVYKFEIPKGGEYQIYLKNEQEGWSKMGVKNFKEGKQELVIPLGDINENLLDENLRIKNYLSDSIYWVSFDYQAPGGGSLFVSEGKSGNIAQTTLLPTGKEIRHFEMFFKSSSGVTSGSLHLSVSNVENLKVEWVYQPEIILRLKNTDTGNLILDTGETIPKITFTKINPTKYKVKVEGAKEPYTLIFSESFHKDWKAYINLQPSGLISPLPLSEQLSFKGNIVASYFDGEIKEGEHKNIFLEKATFETWGKKPISEERHLLVNGYANSWYITPEDAGGKQDYELIIEFAPQKLFYIGLFISGLTLFVCLVFLCYDLINGARRRKAFPVGFKKLDFSSP